jgi:transcriptional regulator with XRE-family HTH domain
METGDRTSILRSLAANVQRIRVQRGWSQAELAETLGIAVRSLQAIEAAEANVRTTRLVALARALRCSVGALVRPARFTRKPRGRPKR